MAGALHHLIIPEVDPEFWGVEGSKGIHGQWGWGERRRADFGGGRFCDGCFEGFPRGDGAKVPVKGCGVYFREVGSAGSGDIWDGGRRYRVVGQICQDCARTECISLLGGEKAWDAGNGGSAAAEINPAGGVYFSEERGAHRQRKRA